MDIYKGLPSTRAEALRTGVKKYFTGKPCSQGHVAPRYAIGACTDCMRASKSKWASMRPEKQKEYADRHYAKHPERLRARALKYARAKLPVPPYPAPPCCEKCRKPFTKTPRLDHDHVTGAFRGWLCDTCNRGLGMLGDTLEGLLEAVAYLRGEKWQAPKESNLHLTVLETDALPLS